MATMIYPARVRLHGSDLSAEFVDFLGLDARAGSLPDLLREARSALSERLRVMEADDAEWPAPSGLDVAADGALQVMWIDVDVDDAPVRVTISIGERLLKQIDDAAEAQGMTRSGFIAVACRASMATMGNKATSKLYEEVSGIGRKVEDALGPESAIGRAIADLDARMLDGFRRMAAEVKGAFKPEGEPTDKTS